MRAAADALAVATREAEAIALRLGALSGALDRAVRLDALTPRLAIAQQHGLDDLCALYGLPSLLVDGKHVGVNLSPAVRAVAQLVIEQTGADRCRSFGRAVQREEPPMLPTEVATIPAPSGAPSWSEGFGLILLGLALLGGALRRSAYRASGRALAVVARVHRRLREGWS